ncbi:hypothetical protein ACQ4PT_021184 [Festuca glaucescens]
MVHKRPLDAVGPASPRKRLRRTVLVMMWLDRSRARAATVEQMAQMVRQVQLDMAKLFVLLMVLVLRIGSMESLLLQLPNMLRALLADQLADFHRYKHVLSSRMQQPQAAAHPNGVCQPSSSRAISEGLPETGGSSGVVRLRFVDADRPKDPLFTGGPVKWQNGGSPKVAIFRNQKKITGGDLSKLQVEILPVYADFFTERGHEDFTEEEFKNQIHRYKGNEVVLTTVNLRNGEADLGSIIFKDSSYRQKLRLTARVKRQDLTVRVQEAITDPFVVKDRRSELNAKSNVPSKGDAIHQLKKISQKGKHWIALTGKNITTVKHLLRQYHKDKSGLQKLTGMKKEAWSTMINHATTCDPGDEIYSYRVAEGELFFNDFYYLVGMMINGLYVPVKDLEKFPQHKVNNWKISAYEKFEERENSGGLIPDYVMCKFNGGPMINGRPVCAVPLNNDAGPSVRATTTWPYPNNMAVQKELGQHDPSMRQHGTPYYPTQENFLNGQGPFSGQPTVPSQNFLSVSEDDLIPGASLFGQQNGSLNSLITDAPGTCPELMADQSFVAAINELPNSNNQFDGYEHDGGNQ